MRSWLLVLTLALACCVHIASAAAHGDRHSSKERPHASSMSHESSKESDEAAEADLDEDEGAPERPEGGVAIAAPTAPHQANRHSELQSSVEVGGALTGKARGKVKLYTEGERGKAGRGYAGTKLGR
ncbi:hypothetical protein R5R35_008520 [Gryllus longicercus]|uniref:Accessory gland protein n=1 Tax=Gryllus longicercus TaxID=2509291 RepID=A0AAN9YXN3_9ORTH